MSTMLINDRSLPAHCVYGCCGGLSEIKAKRSKGSKARLRRAIRHRENNKWRRDAEKEN